MKEEGEGIGGRGGLKREEADAVKEKMKESTLVENSSVFFRYILLSL